MFHMGKRLKALFAPLFTFTVIAAFVTGIPIAHAAQSTTIAQRQQVISTTANDMKYTHRRVETIKLSPSSCATIKKMFPAKASNASLCTATHVELSTDFIPNSHSPKVICGTCGGSGSCPTGDKGFTDDYYDLAFHLKMQSDFNWSGNCGAPSVRSKICTPDWVGGVIDAQDCLAYNPDARSSAARYQLTFNPWGAPIASTAWMRRQCYDDQNCDYHTDAG